VRFEKIRRRSCAYENLSAALLAAIISVLFVANANATIVGSTYDFTTSVTGGTQHGRSTATFSRQAIETEPRRCAG
jgi:hypothetical protein